LIQGNNVASVLQRMSSQVELWEPPGDRKAIFLNCYLMMTDQMYHAIKQQRFNDGVWVGLLLERFAEYYFEALNDYLQNRTTTPIVWLHAHRTTDSNHLHVLQNLFLGINAHINYDLVLTLHDTLSKDWKDMSDEIRAQRFSDHCLVNEIIADTIDRVQDEVIERYSPSMDIVDKGLGRLDEKIFAWLIKRWRAEVWNNFQLYIKCANTDEQASFRTMLEGKVLRRAKLISLGN